MRKNKLGFLLDMVHQLDHPKEDRSTLLIHYANLQTENMDSFSEHHGDEGSCQKKHWPLFDKAQKEGKKTVRHGPNVIIDGNRVPADAIKVAV